MELMTLPDYPLTHILSFLTYKDLLSCSLVCHRLHFLSTENSRVWKKECNTWWGVDSCLEGKSWSETFKTWYRDMGRYINIYLQIRYAWRLIEEFTKANCPGIHASLQPGLTEEDLNQFERANHIALPNEVRCVYRLHNGQSYQGKVPPGVFGTVVFSRYYCSEFLLPLEDATVLRRRLDLPSPCLGIIGCLRSKTVVYMCQDAPLDNHPPGAMFYAFGPDHQRPVVYPDHPCDLFIKAKNFYEWFTTYANDLRDNIYPVYQGGILRFNHDSEAVAVTEHIRIKAATAFMPMMSSIEPPEFVFAYRITLSMDGDVHPRHACQLETRHWVITDDDGRVEKVDGPGVVGDYPVVRPGSTYSYISCTSFKTARGTMHGTYVMRNLETGTAIEAEVPLFRMERPPCVILPGSVRLPQSGSLR